MSNTVREDMDNAVARHNSVEAAWVTSRTGTRLRGPDIRRAELCRSGAGAPRQDALEGVGASQEDGWAHPTLRVEFAQRHRASTASPIGLTWPSSCR